MSYRYHLTLASLNETQAVNTIIHETMHKVWVGSRNHPAGFHEAVTRNTANYYDDNGRLF